jgi:hypothetical protein
MNSEKKNILPLAGIEVFVWLLLLGVTFVISKGAFAINFGTTTLVELIATETARVAASAVLVLVWLLAWKKVADDYLSRTLSRQQSTA